MKKYFLILNFAITFVLISCSEAESDLHMQKNESDSIAYGWMKNDIPSVVWLNGEPISWLKQSGYLRIWNGEPLKRDSNVLRVNILGDSSKINWEDFNVRAVIDGKSKEIKLDLESTKPEFHFDIVNTKPEKMDSLQLVKIDESTKAELLKWSLSYLEKIELKDVNSISKMIQSNNINEVCPWASQAMRLESRVRNLNQMDYVQGNSFALIYPSLDSKIDALLVSEAGNTKLKINYLLFFKARDGNYYFKNRESQEYIRVFIDK